MEKLISIELVKNERIRQIKSEDESIIGWYVT